MFVTVEHDYYYYKFDTNNNILEKIIIDHSMGKKTKQRRHRKNKTVVVVVSKEEERNNNNIHSSSSLIDVSVVVVDHLLPFVSKFNSIMLRFPAYRGQPLSRAEEDCVREFFVRVAEFASKKKKSEQQQQFSYNPLHPITAFMIVNYPEETLHCRCNPFRSSILHRSLRFVSACFQVVIDCSQEEDDRAADFLPPTTAEKYFSSLVNFMEVLRMYSLFFKSKPCQCEEKLLCVLLQPSSSSCSI